ncbi:MAG: hypothetical protein IPH04_14125 [Saprospirales bacterium]|nr:hypothetical protein [Saprospirales bacterium]
MKTALQYDEISDSDTPRHFLFPFDHDTNLSKYQLENIEFLMVIQTTLTSGKNSFPMLHKLVARRIKLPQKNLGVNSQFKACTLENPNARTTD